MPYVTASDGLRLYYTDQGAGTPVLCLPGLTRNGADFSFLAPHLAGYRMICLDFRGRGRSQYAEDFTSYTIAQEAEDTVRLLDHLGLSKVALIGTSRGGLVAMALAAAFPGRLSGGVLNDIGPHVDDEGLGRILQYVGTTPPYASLDEAARALQSGMRPGFPDVSLARWREQAGLMWCEKAGGGLELRYDARLRQAMDIGQAGTGAEDLWGLFDALHDVPLCVLRGENSDLLSTETVKEMARRHPGMDVAVIANRGHVPFLDEPAALLAIHALLERAE